MSDPLAALAAPQGGLKPLPLYATGGVFRGDARFSASAQAEPAAASAPDEDPLSRAFAEGYAAGAEEAREAAATNAEAEAAVREALTLSLTRLTRELADQLRQRMRDTVAALCEEALAPLALDEDALMRRIDRAVALFARADDERVIRLNPDDLKCISPRLAKEWQVVADPALERGALRVEAANGGVEDGPAQWRQAIAEAFEQC